MHFMSCIGMITGALKNMEKCFNLKITSDALGIFARIKFRYFHRRNGETTSRCNPSVRTLRTGGGNVSFDKLYAAGLDGDISVLKMSWPVEPSIALTDMVTLSLNTIQLKE